MTPDPMFSPEVLAELRDINRASLVSTATVKRLTIAGGGAGGANTGARSWTDVAEGVPCRLSPIVPATPSSVADQTAYLGRWLVVVDLEAPAIRAGDRLEVSGVDEAVQPWTRTVLVLGDRSPRTFSAMRPYVCEDVPPGRA
jgi:hypothetical protein